MVPWNAHFYRGFGKIKYARDVSAEHTILYFLQRGRTTEAVEAYARIVDLEKRGGAIAWGKAKKETIEMLEERVKDLRWLCNKCRRTI